jgi:hypothetical protein
MAKLKEISAGYKISIQKNDVWYAVEYSQKKEIESGDDIEKEKEKNWEEVNKEVERQIDELLED